jgi:ppGpp synthetase/RelA/SpoT-type nucleotidyltranferase
MDLIRHCNRVAEGYIKVDKQPFTTKPEALALADEAMPSFERILKRACPSNAKVKTGIKPEESIDNKLHRWSHPSIGRDITTMFDVLRGMIIVDDEEAALDVVHKLSRGPVVAKYEYKDKPKDQYGYYGSHHLDLYLPEFKIVAEIQIMTRRLKAVKSIAHKIYSKHRSNAEGPPPEVAAHSRELYRIGNRPKIRLKRRPEPPVDLSEH